MKQLIKSTILAAALALVGCQSDMPEGDAGYIQNISVSIDSDITADFEEAPFTRATEMQGNVPITEFSAGDSLSLSFQNEYPAFKIGYDGTQWNTPTNIPAEAAARIQMELFNNADSEKDAEGRYYDVLVMNGSHYDAATKTLTLTLGHYYGQAVVNVENVERYEEIASMTALWVDEAGRNEETITLTRSASKFSWSAITRQGTIKSLTYTYADGTEVVANGVNASVYANKSHLTFLTGVMPSGIELVGDVYYIYDGKGLKTFADIVNGANGQTQNLAANGKLIAPIDLSSICGDGIGNWIPIGSKDNAYAGIFDGNGKTVSKLYINDTEDSYQGLFGRIEGAEIKSLGVSGTVSGNRYIGGVVGYANNGSTLTACYSAVSIKSIVNASTGMPSACVGGVAGNINNNSILTACYNTGTVSIEGGGGSMDFGGVAGSVGNGSSLTSCYSTGTGSDHSYFGGVAGSVSSSTVQNCASVSNEGTNGIGYSNGVTTITNVKDGITSIDKATNLGNDANYGTTTHSGKMGGSTDWVAPLLTWQE